MALIDSHSTPTPSLVPGRQFSAPSSALVRLRALHDEASEAIGLGRFLASAVHAGAALILMGMGLLSFAAGTALQPCFAWSVLVLLGVGALLKSYIRSTASAFDRAPMREAAKDLRALLFYCGFAWGAGALLVLSPVAATPLVLGFAGFPSLCLALLVRDREGSLAFLIPVTALTIAAALIRPWQGAGLDTALLLALQSAIAGHILLRGRRGQQPAGLALG
jgi:hypothetical protein